MAPEMLAAFDEWLAERGETLTIPMTVVARAPGSIRLTFAAIIDAVEVLILSNEIVVTVGHDERCWDILAEFECVPLVVPGGVTCSHCDPADRVIYPDNRVLFLEHLFEPLAQWIATTLFPADAIGLYGTSGDGATSATLLSAKDYRGYDVIIPLRPL
jgi:hypothetical protein